MVAAAVVEEERTEEEEAVVVVVVASSWVVEAVLLPRPVPEDPIVHEDRREEEAGLPGVPEAPEEAPSSQQQLPPREDRSL